MPTTWALTAGDVVKQAMKELGAIASGEEPTTDEMTDGILRLNGMLNTWAGENNLYREAEGTLTIVGATGAGTLPADIRAVNSVRHVISATNSRPLARWNRDEFYVLPNRATVGNPSAYYLRKTTSALELYVWPVPADDVDLELDYSRAPNTVATSADALDVPQDWQETVLYGLASRLASMFGGTRVDPGMVQRVDGRASELFQRLLDRDRPDSIYLYANDGCW